MGIQLGIISLILNRKWYNSIKGNKKKKAKAGYIVLMIFDIFAICVGTIQMIKLIIHLS